jgi:hypothetical protein
MGFQGVSRGFSGEIRVQKAPHIHCFKKFIRDEGKVACRRFRFLAQYGDKEVAQGA